MTFSAALASATDQEVVAWARDGVEAAYRELLRRYERPVFSLIYRMVRDRELSEDQRADLSAEVVEAHCGHADEHTVKMMIGLQVLKDAWMARALTRHGKGAVLVAGQRFCQECPKS